jgi:hypothetical protein
MTVRTLTFTFKLLIFLFLIACGFRPAVFAQRWCCEGNNWLRWSKARRESYVNGFIHGYYGGLVQGCGTAAKCLERKLDFGDGVEKLTDKVTNFYKRYPENRILFPDEILVEIGSGNSLERIHDHPPFPARQVSRRSANGVSGFVVK